MTAPTGQQHVVALMTADLYDDIDSLTQIIRELDRDTLEHVTAHLVGAVHGVSNSLAKALGQDPAEMYARVVRAYGQRTAREST